MTEGDSKARPSRDRNLLFGVFAVQNHFITPAQLAQAAGAWAGDPSSGLGEVLVRMGYISDKSRELIDSLLDAQVEDHGNDVSETLRSFGGVQAVNDSFRGAVGFGQGPSKLDSLGGPSRDPQEAEKGAEDSALEDIEKVTLGHAGRYTFKGKAGRGAIGQVLIAFDEHIGREVALKELLPDLPSGSGPSTGRSRSRLTAEATARFIREARVTGQLEHPGIVPVYEIARRDDESIYYTMKLVRGKTLEDRLKSCKSLHDRIRLLPHFLDLCQAVAYAHSKGVVHRDLKPANVMVGEFGETVVLDWGLAKVRGVEDVRAEELAENLKLIKDARASETVKGQPIGTPAYMSPEQAEGKIEEIDERSDVWGLGAILYEILTGGPPFPGNYCYEVMGRVISETPAPVVEIEPKAPSELCAIAEKCLVKEKKKRYSDAAELAGDVAAFQSGGLVSAYDYSMASLFKRWVVKRWPVLATVTAALVVLIVLAVFSFFRIREQRNIALHQKKEAIRQRVLTEIREREATRSLAEAYYQFGLLAEKDKRWNDARLYYAHSLTMQDAEKVRSGYFLSATRPLQASLSKSFDAHKHSIFDVSFSPDGKRFISSGCAEKEAGNCVKGSVKLWSADGKLIRSFPGHTSWVKAAGFSPDGKYVLSGSYDNTLKLWDAETGECLRTFSGHNEMVYSVDFSSNGKRAVSGGYVRSFKIWDVATGECLYTSPESEHSVGQVMFAPDEKHVLSAGDKPALQLWSVAENKIVREFEGHKFRITSIDISPDGKHAATASWDKTVKLWDLSSGECLKTFPGHQGRVYTVKFSPSGKYLVSGGMDRTIKLWSVETGECVSTLTGHDSQVWTAAFSPDGLKMVSGSEKTINIWKIDFSGIFASFKGSPNLLWNMDLSPAGKYLAISSSEGPNSSAPRLWSFENKKFVKTFDTFVYPFVFLDFSPDGSRLAAGSCGETTDFMCSGGRLVVYDVESGAAVQEIYGHSLEVSSLAYSPEGKYVATGTCGNYEMKLGCTQGEIKLWDVETGDCVWTAKGHENWIFSLDFSPDGELLLSSGSWDTTLKMWSVKDGSPLRTFKGHGLRVDEVKFAKDGKQLVSASLDKTARLWDVETGEILRTFRGHDTGVLRARFSPDGKMLMTAGWDHKVKLWSLDDGKCVLTYRGHDSVATFADFTPDMSMVISASDNGNVTIWPLKKSVLEDPPEKLLEHARKQTGFKLDEFKPVPLTKDEKGL